MLKPVKTSFYDSDKIFGFVHFPKDAATLLGGRVKDYEIALPYRTHDTNLAWDAAGRLHQFFNNWITENMGIKEPRGPYPRVVTQSTAKGGGYTLMLDFFLLARDLPVGRTVKEALENPIAYYPRTRRRKLFYKGKTGVHKTTVLLPKSYMKRESAERKYKSLILCDAVRIEKSKTDERYHARLTYWRLDPIQLPRDIPAQPDENENFDLWGNWKTQQTATYTNNIPLFESIEEGSGVPMGADRRGSAPVSAKED